jgi:hypothetical protein
LRQRKGQTGGWVVVKKEGDGCEEGDVCETKKPP